MNGKLIKILGAAATIGGLLASVVSDWVNERKMETMIDEKVNKALADKESETEEEEP